MRLVSDKTVGRLSLYRRLLSGLRQSPAQGIYSHELASLSGTTSAQVRRDLMAVGCSGSPSHGYDVGQLIEAISGFLDGSESQGAALVGVGNLGRAIMTYFGGRRPNLSIVAAFDKDPYKVDRVIHGCRCHRLDELPRVAASQQIRIGIITVPAEEAQTVAELLVRSGIRAILNFAPLPIRVPDAIYVEDIDMTMSLEKVAYFARQRAAETAVRP